MNTYWVYENIKKQPSFYNKLDVLLLLCSGVLWKKHHPTHTTVLYCDKLTESFLKTINASSIWDKIKIAPENKHVDKSIFWASSKLEVLRYVEAPCILMDHDFLAYKSFDKYLNDIPVFTQDENGERYYPTAYDPFIRKVNDLIPRPQPYAINCSFMYFTDTQFVNKYGKFSLELMERFTQLKVPNSKFLIFAEQLGLKYLLDFFKIEYNTLLNEKWNPGEGKYEPNDKGIFSVEESLTIFRHYWLDKPRIKNSKEGFSFEAEIRILFNILSSFKELNLKVINDLK